MKTLTVRLPEALVAQIDAEAKARDESKSDVVRHTMQKFALLGSETLVVGDSVDDARAAQACGMRFVAMSQGYGGAHCQSEAPVAAVCAALSELLPLVATWRQPSRGEP